MTKKHNWVTGPNHKVVEADHAAAMRASICACNHLTPATEAEMENLITPGSVRVPTRAEVITRNEPGYIDPPRGLETVETPVKDWGVDLDVIEPPEDAYEYDRTRVTR